MDGRLNVALILIDRILEEIEYGFVSFYTCGEQEETENLDFVNDIKTVKSELLAMIDKKTCGWGVDDNGIYTTECGNLFEVMNGTPTENGMQFCPYCGREILDAAT